MIKTEEKKSLRDFKLFVMFSPFFLVLFALSAVASGNQATLNTIYIFFAMYAASGIGILFYMYTYGEPEVDGAYRIDFDENLNLNSVIIIIIGVLLLFAISTFFGSLQRGLFYVPLISVVPTIAVLDPVKKSLTEFLWQVFNVAYGEEMLKLVAILALTQRFRKLGDPTREILGAGFPIIGWGLLHAQLAYAGNMYMTMGAIFAGVVLYGAMRFANSVLASIMIHGIYNTIVAMMAFGLLSPFSIIALVFNFMSIFIVIRVEPK